MDLTSVVTIAGNLTRDPEVRKLSDGRSAARITLASTPRVFDRESKEWKDGETTFIDASAFGDLADHIEDSFRSGERVIVQGRLQQQNWDDKDTGTKRSKIALLIDEVGHSLKFGTTTYTKGRKVRAAQQQADDGWGNSFPDDTPF